MRLAIIPARGGSKRIPHKNIKPFNGKPIIAYSVEAAIQSKLFDEVMVSTDDENIAQIAREYDAKVPFFRSKDNSDDFATISDVLEEVINTYISNGHEIESVCCIYPTAPFVSSQKLRDAHDIFEKEAAESVLTVVKYSYPPQRAIIIKDGLASFQYIKNRYKRSQDLEPIYHDAGQFYFLRREAFIEQHDLILSRTIPFVVSELEVQDIDNETDWRLAEIKYKMMENSNGG